MARRRCPWCCGDVLMERYHDEEWGLPLRDECRLFELLCLEGAQAGLSWRTILHKREGYRRAFAGFVPARVAAFDEGKQGELRQDGRIVRNRAKIRAIVGNARALLALRTAGVDFVTLLWQFVEGTPRQNHWSMSAEIPTQTMESRAMSAALRSAGFRFVGPTICYAFMQASGMVNDHLTSCYRYAEIAAFAS